MGREVDKAIIYLAPTADEHFPNEEQVLLENILNCVGLTLREFYVTTIVKCRVPYQTTPTKEELNTCMTTYLEEELKGINYVLALGSGAGKALLGDKFSITKQRGTYLIKDIPTHFTYHPRYLLRFPSLEVNSPKWEAWQDIIAFKDLITNGLPF